MRAQLAAISPSAEIQSLDVHMTTPNRRPIYYVGTVDVKILELILPRVFYKFPHHMKSSYYYIWSDSATAQFKL